MRRSVCAGCGSLGAHVLIYEVHDISHTRFFNDDDDDAVALALSAAPLLWCWPPPSAAVLPWCRHGIESAEIIPTVESDYGSPDVVEPETGIVFVKTVIFQVCETTTAVV